MKKPDDPHAPATRGEILRSMKVALEKYRIRQDTHELETISALHVEIVMDGCSSRAERAKADAIHEEALRCGPPQGPSIMSLGLYPADGKCGFQLGGPSARVETTEEERQKEEAS